MRPAAIAITGFVFLVLIFAGIFYVQLALFCLAVLLCLPLAIGFICQGHKSRTFWIPTASRAEVDESTLPQAAVINIEGRSFSVNALPDRLEFMVRCRNMHLLAAIGLVGTGALLACLVGTRSLWKPMDVDSPFYFAFYFLCFLVALLFFPTLKWLSECSMIPRSAITLASIQRQSRGGLGTMWIGYEFTDSLGGHHGGSVMDFGGPKEDQLKVVFCSPINPEVNVLSCGLLFHEVTWAAAVR